MIMEIFPTAWFYLLDEFTIIIFYGWCSQHAIRTFSYTHSHTPLIGPPITNKKRDLDNGRR